MAKRHRIVLPVPDPGGFIDEAILRQGEGRAHFFNKDLIDQAMEEIKKDAVGQIEGKDVVQIDTVLQEIKEIVFGEQTE